MTPAEQKQAAESFAAYWKGKGYEKGQTQPFWLSLLRTLGVEHPERVIEFEDKAHIDAKHGFIDGYIPSTRVMVEQKSLGKSLRSGIVQADGSVLTPFQQAKRYCLDLPVSRHPRWIVTSNFEEFLIYDMERPNAEPESLLLKDLPNETYRLSFLTQTEADFIRREEEISKAAGDVVGKIYDALLKQYRDPTNPASLKSLNELCVRLVFLFYAEDAGVFHHLQFRDYIKRFAARDARRALIDLFKVLDTKPEDRDPYLEPDLAAFPYVNGGLFANENLEIPQFTDEILSLVIKNGSEEFDWKDISPTIFGAVFESTLNPETRRSGGMHYTSLANIHKVIGPLFLDALRAELSTIKTSADGAKVRDARLRAFVDKLASLTFLDPACGSGNFLTETYVCLRRLENEALALLLGGQSILDFDGSLVKVSIRQFHGIEINDFAVAVAKSALWIAESQMLNETQTLLRRNIDFLPLKTYDGIVEGNALRMDWGSLAPNFDYIMGNPPFVGYSLQSETQKAEILDLYRDEQGKPYKTAGKIDYVAGWYWKGSEYMAAHPSTRTALVSTNSITQGEQVASVWKPLVERFGVSIDFAHRTFRWDSESNSKAHVHCVIVGFSCGEQSPMRANGSANASLEGESQKAGVLATASDKSEPKPLFEGERVSLVDHINPYLFAGPDIWVESPVHPLCAAPEMTTGNRPADGGALIIEDEDLASFLKQSPDAEKYIKRLAGSSEFINGRKRWCLWLVGASPQELLKMPAVMERIAKCRENRLAAPDPGRRKLAETPTLFRETLNPATCVAVPEVSSESRRYVPIGFLDQNTITTNKIKIIPNATLYHFGVLTSNVHMAWMRTVCGRLKSDYSYSNNLVYNNFPWPGAETNPKKPVHLCVTAEQRERIEQMAQGILDARAKYPDSSLAALYNELTMPPELREAHRENDRAVMAAYGFPKGMTESECVAALFERYKSLVEK